MLCVFVCEIFSMKTYICIHLCIYAYACYIYIYTYAVKEGVCGKVLQTPVSGKESSNIIRLRFYFRI